MEENIKWKKRGKRDYGFENICTGQIKTDTTDTENQKCMHTTVTLIHKASFPSELFFFFLASFYAFLRTWHPCLR